MKYCGKMEAEAVIEGQETERDGERQKVTGREGRRKAEGSLLFLSAVFVVIFFSL